jgi:hypothetical protein
LRKCKSRHNGDVPPLSMADSVNMKAATTISPQPADSMIFLGMAGRDSPKNQHHPHSIVDAMRLFLSN